MSACDQNGGTSFISEDNRTRKELDRKAIDGYRVGMRVATKQGKKGTIHRFVAWAGMEYADVEFSIMHKGNFKFLKMLYLKSLTEIPKEETDGLEGHHEHQEEAGAEESQA